SRRTLLIFAAVALPLVVVGLFVLQQKRQVGLFDLRDESTSWRLMVWRDGARVLASEPRHLLVGVGMDSLKRHWREWGMFDKGRQPWGHLHSTPLQIAFERGVPTLLVWAAWLFVYVRMLWRVLRRGAFGSWVERGLVLGALGGTVGFVAGGVGPYKFGGPPVVVGFSFVLGLALSAHRCNPPPAPAQAGWPARVPPQADE